MIKSGLTLFSILILLCCSQRINKLVNSMSFDSKECTPATDYDEMISWRKKTGYDILLAPQEDRNETPKYAILFLHQLENEHFSILFDYFDCLNRTLMSSLDEQKNFVFHIDNSDPLDELHYSIMIKNDTIFQVFSLGSGSTY